MTEVTPHPERIVREAECKDRTGLSRVTRWRLERDGKFPKRRRISANAVGWLESELRKWIASREAA
jgi:prophage regulatory protein